MGAFLSRRFREYMILAVGAPLAAYVLDGIGKQIEDRRGASRLTRGLRSGGDLLRRHGRGPLGRRLRDRDPGRAV